jgi:tRNA(Ile)-lysidine synthase TilS/MesJ
MKDLPDLKQRVLDFIGLHNLFNDNKPLLLAVSGGPDSVCLLHILRQLRDELNLNLSVVHLNHQLRGEESAADASKVEMSSHIRPNIVFPWKKPPATCVTHSLPR